MAKKRIRYICTECDYEAGFKFGLCPSCKKGKGVPIENSIELEKLNGKKIEIDINKEFEYKNIKNVDLSDNNGIYLDTGYILLNNVFGNKKGIEKNSLTLLSGAPGIGKSTLLLKIIDSISKEHKSAYISTEESSKQIKQRYNRLNLNQEFVIDNLKNVHEIFNKYKNFDFLILDSINELYIEDSGVKGGTSQLKEITSTLMKLSKEFNTTIIIIGQVVKDGSIAGPKNMEHMVDTILFFDKYDTSNKYRVIYSNKNRFGKTDEMVIFEMKESGLEEIENPSLLFIDKDRKNKIGSSISLIKDKGRPIFVESEALLIETKADTPYNQAIGIDLKRLNQITAIIGKYCGIKIYNYNLFVNILNGLTVKKTSIDLSVLMSILSSFRNKSLDDYIFIGELTLSGNIKMVEDEEYLIEQAKKMGFKKIISNTTSYKRIDDVLELI